MKRPLCLWLSHWIHCDWVSQVVCEIELCWTLAMFWVFGCRLWSHWAVPCYVRQLGGYHRLVFWDLKPFSEQNTFLPSFLRMLSHLLRVTNWKGICSLDLEVDRSCLVFLGFVAFSYLGWAELNAHPSRDGFLAAPSCKQQSLWHPPAWCSIAHAFEDTGAKRLVKKWLWVKKKSLGDHRFWSIFPFTNRNF